MADNGSSKLGAVMTWIAGIAGSVIAAVIIYHLTQPPKPVPTPTYPQYGLTGLVTDSATKQPIAHAIVTASFEGNVKDYTTDGSGEYLFTMDGAKYGPDVVTVDVVADGYAFFRASDLSITPGNNYAGFPLVSNAPAVAAVTPTPAGNGGTAVTPAGNTGGATIVNPNFAVQRVQPQNFVRPGISAYIPLKKP
jgi:hypothetical protein